MHNDIINAHKITNMKQELRNRIKLERLNHHPDLKIQKDFTISRKISRLKEFISAQNILFYMPIHGEVSLLSLFEKNKNTKIFILPKVNEKSKTLSLYAINELKELTNGSYNIPEPTIKHKEIKDENIDLVLVPGVVFSKDGHRIGFGKGYYDRLLKTLKCPKIGIAYDFQIVENILGEPHDVPMDIIVSENQFIKV